eukprot:TRINITY_DN9988_c1_g1_i1.p2 TRINITY_DN9988_c1_g1~~TRINITY_DN9988_c1_g1_i1.p2  ORF type:complete len:550 (+),score=148.40 TRINITY_DN9988_c1_g1_i1:75-1652(+)
MPPVCPQVALRLRRGRGELARADVGGGAAGPGSPGGRHYSPTKRAAPQGKGLAAGCGSPRAQEQSRPRASRRGRTPEPYAATHGLLTHPGHAGGCAEDLCADDSRHRYGTRVLRGAGQSIGLTVDERMTVIAVASGSAAEAAGLRSGQRLREVNGVQVGTQDEAVAAMGASGREVFIRVEDRRKTAEGQGKSPCHDSPRRPKMRQGDHPWAWLQDESPVVATPPPGLPGVGSGHSFGPDCRDPAGSPLRRPRRHEIPAKPTAHSPALPTDTGRAAPLGHSNKTSYQLAVERGHAGEDMRWAPASPSAGRARPPLAERHSGDITAHSAPVSPAARGALWREHCSPARGRQPVQRRAAAVGAIPALLTPAPPSETRLYEGPGKRRVDSQCAMVGPSVVDPGAERPQRTAVARSRTLDRPRSSWTCHGDLLSWRDAHEVGHRGDPSPTGTRLRSYHDQVSLPFTAPPLPTRSFTPTLRRQRPTPEPTNTLEHDVWRAEPSPRAGRRSDPQSPHASHRSHNVWACMRTE